MKELKAFLDKIKNDHRIGTAHISLYVALLGLREEIPAAVFFPIDRQELMERSKILGKTLYYKCLRELASFGYIQYRPEHHPGRKSAVKIIFERSNKQL